MLTPLAQYGRTVAALTAALLLASVGALVPSRPASAQAGCRAAIDLVLVLDGSESISAGDFTTMASFARDLVGHFTISPTDAHAGVVQFAGEGDGRVEIGLSYDPAALDAALAAMTQIIGATDIQEGIALGQGELAVRGRAEVPRVLIVLTDGAHNQPGDPLAEAEGARSAGTEIFAIAVGSGPDRAQLTAIASDPDTEHVFSVTDFDGLVTILAPLVQVVCPPPPTATPPVPGGLTPTATPQPGGGDGTTPEGTPVLGVVQLPSVGEDGARSGDGPAVPVLWALAGLGGVLVLVFAAWRVASGPARR